MLVLHYKHSILWGKGRGEEFGGGGRGEEFELFLGGGGEGFEGVWVKDLRGWG